MARETYVLRDGELVPKHLAAPRDGGPAFNVIRDSMDPIRSHADGKVYDSKSVYRRSLKAGGFIEVGNDRMESRPAPRPSIAPDIQRSIHQLSSR